jgi:hypothetical protein
MSMLRFGTAGSVELLAVESLPPAPTPAAALAADRERLLAHPLVFRDKILFSTGRGSHIAYIAGLQSCQALLHPVSHAGTTVPVVSPLTAVTWEHDGGAEAVQVHLLLGLKRPDQAPDTRAEHVPPKPPPADRRQWLWIAGTFAMMTALGLGLGHWASRWTAIAAAIGLISGGATTGALQALWYDRVRAPAVDETDGYWQTVRALASRQIATSALPGEWTVSAIPAGEARGRDWSWEIGAAVTVLVSGALLRWPPAD